MDEKITAEWARKTAIDVLGEKVSKQLKDCELSIKTAVDQNKLSATLYIKAEELVFAELKKRGFRFQQHMASSQRDDDYLEISW